MSQLMKLSNGQYLLTIPKGIVETLQAQPGDKIGFQIDLKRGKVWLEKTVSI